MILPCVSSNAPVVPVNSCSCGSVYTAATAVLCKKFISIMGRQRVPEAGHCLSVLVSWLRYKQRLSRLFYPPSDVFGSDDPKGLFQHK